MLSCVLTYIVTNTNLHQGVIFVSRKVVQHLCFMLHQLGPMVLYVHCTLVCTPPEKCLINAMYMTNHVHRALWKEKAREKEKRKRRKGSSQQKETERHTNTQYTHITNSKLLSPWLNENTNGYHMTKKILGKHTKLPQWPRISNIHPQWLRNLRTSAPQA